MSAGIQIARIVVIVALLCVAAAIATPKGRIPLALRGMAKMFRITTEEKAVPAWKKAVAFLLVLVAVVVAAAL